MAEDTIFGICQVCGNDGGDAPAASLSGADSISNIVEAGSGVVLEWYKGQLMCEPCKNRLSSDEESRLAAEKHAESQQFRDQTGFTRSV